MPPRILLLDFDGVLNESMVFGAWLNSEHGIGRTQQQAFFEGPFPDCNRGAKDMRAVLPAYLKRWGWQTGLDDFIDRWFAMDDKLDREMLAAVDELRRRGVPVALATNQEQHRARYIRSHPELANRFDHWFFACELGAAKPSPMFYSAIGRLLGYPGDDLLFFDDHPLNVVAAKNAGWHAEQFTGIAGFQSALIRAGLAV